MSEFKRKITTEKEKLKRMKAPETLELRLKKALENQPERRKLSLPKWGWIAASIFLLLFISYQHQTFSYFGKKIFGYDALTNETLIQLMENELGQPIEKSIVFDDGNTLIVDAVLSDENQFVVYLRLKNTGERSHFNELFEDDIFTINGLSAFLTKYNGHSSVSMVDKTTNEIKMVATFDQVSPFAKKVNLMGIYDDAPFTLSFPYDANKALATGLKKKLNSKVTVDSEQLKFGKLIATPTSTLVQGTFKNSEVYFDQIELLVNGKKIEQLGSSAKTNLLSKKFTITYEALPEEVESIGLAVKAYPATQLVEQSFPLKAGEKLSGAWQEIFIDKIALEDGKLAVTITTEKGLRLNDVYVIEDEKKVELDQTINYTEKSTADGLRTTRTLLFNTEEIPNAIEFGSYEYLKTVDYYKEWKIK